MPLPIARGRYGKYLPGLQTVIDAILLNAIFTVLVVINTDIDFHFKLRVMWVGLNVAFVPMGAFFFHVHRKRTIRVDRLVMSSIEGVIIHAPFYLSLLWFLAIAEIPLRFFGELYGSCLILFPLSWLIEFRILKRYRRRGGNVKNVIIFGTGETARRVARNLRADAGYGVKIHGYFDNDPSEGFEGKYRGSLDDMDKFCKDNAIQEIYYAISGEDEDTLRQVIRVADDNICKFYYVPPLSHYIKRSFSLEPINGSLPALTLHPTPLHNVLNRAVKRSFDIIFSATAIAISPIILLPVAIAIKASSPGPVFFKQIRTGYRGREFYCYKFRTMKVNADSDKRQATKNDDRKTRVGDFLRRTSIDELPQFWNVMRGDMSVVGPRPHMLAHTETYRRLIDQYMVRHVIKPGITGWAQINGFRGATEELWQMERRVDNDVWYIEHWSFMLDLRIIVRTITNALGGEDNAY